MSVRAIREVLERHGLHLHRDRGQNFLVDLQQAVRLVELAGVTSDESVIEVGTGLGTLTRALADRARHVHTIEIDAGLVRALREESLLPAGVELQHADALEIDWNALIAAQRPPVKVVANLPYSAATPLLRRLLDFRDRLSGWSVMVQREIANRIRADCGSSDYGSLSVIHQLCVRSRRELELHPQCFFPAPRVKSTFLCLEPLASPLLAEGELERVEKWVRAGFQHRRKTLLQALKLAGHGDPASALREAEIDPRSRAEALPPETWQRLARALESERAQPDPAP